MLNAPTPLRLHPPSPRRGRRLRPRPGRDPRGPPLPPLRRHRSRGPDRLLHRLRRGGGPRPAHCDGSGETRYRVIRNGTVDTHETFVEALAAYQRTGAGGSLWAGPEDGEHGDGLTADEDAALARVDGRAA